MMPTLGRLERVDLREAWKHEAAEFTPWLAHGENLQLLAEASGLPELELVATEHARRGVRCRHPLHGRCG